MRRQKYTPISQHPELKIYHDLYDRYRVESHILNGGSKRLGANSPLLWDQKNITDEIKIYEGEDDEKHKGQYIDRHNQWVNSKVKSAKDRLEEIENRFATYRKDRINSGFRDSEEMPKELFEQRLQAEARLDVYSEELNELKKRLATFEERQEIAVNTLLLKDGPTAGVSQVGWDGVLKMLDYQSTGYIGDVLCITAKESPYYGLSILQYRELVAEPWLKAYRQIDQTAKRRFIQAQLSKNRNLITAELEELWRTEKAKRIADHPEWRELFSIRIAGKPDMPPFPKGCINHAKKVE